MHLPLKGDTYLNIFQSSADLVGGRAAMPNQSALFSGATRQCRRPRQRFDCGWRCLRQKRVFLHGIGSGAQSSDDVRSGGCGDGKPRHRGHVVSARKGIKGMGTTTANWARRPEQGVV